MRIIPFPLDFISQFTLIVDWEQRKLGELIESANYGLNASASEYDGENKYIRITDIDEVTREFSQNNLTSPNVKLLLADNYLLRTDDILFARTGASVGKSYIYNNNDGKVYYAGFLIRVRVDNKNNALFIFQYTLTEKYNNFVRITSQRSGQPGINVNEYLNLSIMTPKLDEQAKIGELLKKLDNTIALHQRKLEALLKLKEVYLKDMFPENEKSVPKLRLANFKGDWKQHKLGDVAQITMGQSPNSEYYTDNPNDYILVQGNADMKNGLVVPRIWTTQVTKQAQKNDLILSVRAPVGDVAKTDFDIVIGRGVAAIKGNEFIFQLLGRMKEIGYWNKFSTGSTFESINTKDIKDAIVLIPDGKEQTQIGSFFKQLDNRIILHQQKLKHLQNLKRAYLQKMFI